MIRLEITRTSKTSPKSNLETNEKIYIDKNILPELTQKNIDDLRLKDKNF